MVVDGGSFMHGKSEDIDKFFSRLQETEAGNGRGNERGKNHMKVKLVLP